jgi:hypothetical protein
MYEGINLFKHATILHHQILTNLPFSTKFHSPGRLGLFRIALHWSEKNKQQDGQRC